MSMMNTARRSRDRGVGRVIGDVADVFGVEVSHIKAKTRGVYAVSDARFAVYKILYSSGMTLHQIGRILKRDHGAVLHGIRKFDERRHIEKKFAAKVSELQRIGYEV